MAIRFKLERAFDLHWSPPSPGYRDPYGPDGMRLLTDDERHEAEKLDLGVDDMLARRRCRRPRPLR